MKPVASLTFLDAEACIALLKGKPGIAQVMKQFPGPFATTTPALFEVHAGIEYFRVKGMHDVEVHSLEQLERLTIFDLDLAGARKASAIWAGLKAQGRIIKVMDILISGIMLSRDQHHIITNDTHYGHVSGMVTHPYSLAP